jgi:hypothetical protein
MTLNRLFDIRPRPQEIASIVVQIIPVSLNGVLHGC